MRSSLIGLSAVLVVVCGCMDRAPCPYGVFPRFAPRMHYMPARIGADGKSMWILFVSAPGEPNCDPGWSRFALREISGGAVVELNEPRFAKGSVYFNVELRDFDHVTTQQRIVFDLTGNSSSQVQTITIEIDPLPDLRLRVDGREVEVTRGGEQAGGT